MKYFILFVLTGFFIYLSLGTEKVSPDVIREMKLKIHPYSGLNSDLYLQFVNNIELFGQNISNVSLASQYFYRAIQNLNDLHLYTDTSQFRRQIKEISIKGEKMLLESSLKYGSLFVPRYLNNTFEYSL